MNTFEDFKIKKQLLNGIQDLGYEKPTPIQLESYAPIMSGGDFVGIAQTGTGKTMAYLLPLLQDLKYSEQAHPRILILAPTRELVIQIVEQIERLASYITLRVAGVYGGSNNINKQKVQVAEGLDIIVGTPRRLYDLAISNVLRLKGIKKVVVDEVDIMLDFGYKTQLRNLFELIPPKRQHILFSATMTTYVDELITNFLIKPTKKTISISGTPLSNISQSCYAAHNFYTKVNLLNHLLQDTETYSRVLVFVRTRIDADRLYDLIDEQPVSEIIHAKKEPNHRSNAIEQFTNGSKRILIATDVISRGIDLDSVTHVISFDTPLYPENYIHRIGRTGRAEEKGNALLFFTEKERESKKAIETLMNFKIPLSPWPGEVTVNPKLTPEEKEKPIEVDEITLKKPQVEKGAAFHEKSAKNKKEKVERVSYEKQLKDRYKKPIRRGDKIQNMKKKPRRR